MTKPLTIFLSLFVAISTAAQADWYEVSAKPSLVVRGAPDTAANKVGNIPYGEKINVIDKADKVVTIDGQTGSWVKVQWKDSSGYVFDAFLTKYVNAPTSNKPVAVYDDSNEAKQDIQADTSSSLENKTDQTNIAEESTTETDTSDQTKIIVVTGYGIDHDKALKNALQSAIEQQVGVLVDSETIIKNDELIKNEILTASNGFVEKYDEISTSVNNGLTEVKIKAEVKQQEVAKKIKSLNISMLKVQEDTSNIYAEVITKDKSKEDRVKMLDNTLQEILSEQSYNELLEVKLDGYEILKDEAKDGKTPIEISYVVGFNYASYEKKMKKLEETLEGIGAIYKPKTNYPKVNYQSDDLDDFTLAASAGSDKIFNNSLSIIKKNGKIYVQDTWEIPKEINYSNKVPHDKSDYLIGIELLDKDGSILNASAESIMFYRFIYEVPPHEGIDYSPDLPPDFNFGESSYVFAPFFCTNIIHSTLNDKKRFKIKMMLDNEDLKGFDKITIQHQ